MTPEELDEARVKEAVRLYFALHLKDRTPKNLVRIAFELERSGGTPPPPAPEVLAAREWMKDNDFDMYAVNDGRHDEHLEAKAFLAGWRAARKEAAR